LVLADGRLPAGGHAHSGGIEAAVVDGTVTGVDDLAAFLRGRLETAGFVAAAFAAAACRTVLAGGPDPVGAVADLDAELDARTPSPAQRAASRAQGRALLRAGRAAWPSSDLELRGPARSGPEPSERAGPETAGPETAGPGPAGLEPPSAGRPRASLHHPVALGVVAAAAGLTPADAALAAAYGAVTGPASAATRLLGLDPLAVTALLARLAADVDTTAAAAERESRRPPRLLPATSAVRLDLLAERHRTAEVRMFAS
jgi:urease accessory protein